MTELERLMDALCPDGVEYRALSEIGKFYGGLTGKSKDDFQNGNEKYVSYMNVFSNIAVDPHVDTTVKIGKKERQNAVEQGDILFTGSSETPNECGMSSVLVADSAEPLYLNSFCFGLRLWDSYLLFPGFAKHLFRAHGVRQQIIKTASGVTRFNISKEKMGKVRIPLPPPSVQREIAAVLDTFMELRTELEMELRGRKRQYEHYRDKIVSFGNTAGLKKLGEIAEIRVGQALPEKVSGDGPYPFINAGTTPSGYINSYNSLPDTITTPSRGQGGIGYVGYQKAPFWCGPLCYRIQSGDDQILTRYLYYCLCSAKQKLMDMKHTGSVPALNRKELTHLSIPVPSLVEQERVVAMLDRIDALVNDTAEGLPAEIVARRKQYEYYRDQLLTFKERVQ